VTRKKRRKKGKREEGSNNGRLEEREKEINERVYEVNMKETWKKYERKREGQGK
jgi:hypothetical protein